MPGRSASKLSECLLVLFSSYMRGQSRRSNDVVANVSRAFDGAQWDINHFLSHGIQAVISVGWDDGGRTGYVQPVRHAATSTPRL